MQQKTNIEIVQVPISQLRPSEYNPRKMSDKQEADLTESLKRFQFVDPIIVNSFPAREGVVIGGHQRLKIAKKIGYKDVPVVYLNLNLEQEKELNLRLNANGGEWDYDLLKNFNLNLLMDVGFDNKDLEQMFDDVLEIDNDNFDEQKELIKAQETNIKTGDLFQLGYHRLLCADSLKPNSIENLMDNQKANIIYVDPIYNIGLDYNKGLGGKSNYGGTTNDNKNEREYCQFIKNLIVNSKLVAQDNAHFFYYCDQKYVGMLQNLYQELGIDYKRTCLWIKNGFNPTPKIAFNKAYGPVVYGIIGKPYLSDIKNLDEILNKEVGSGNRLIEDITDIFDIWLAKRQSGELYEHPTQKPPTLHEKPLRRCTRVGDIVLDICAGSGSTLIACEQLKRNAYLCEIEPVFCQVIINRWEKLTNQKVNLLKNIYDNTN